MIFRNAIIHRIIRFISSKLAKRIDHRIFRGYFDNVQYDNGELIVSGWTLSLYGPFDELILYINGEKQTPGQVIERPDVGNGLPDIPRSNLSGFSFHIAKNEDELEGLIDIRLSCIQAQQEVDRMETGFFIDLYESMPAPPLKFIKRVDGSESQNFYLLKGAQNYREFQQLISKHCQNQTISTMLDWGCGSGRLTGFFLQYAAIDNIFGCDIDAEAAQWAQQNFPQGKFDAIPLHPPTQYDDQQFDLIISFSVLTHLDRENQIAWLKEMKRILKPGGTFIATIHGVSAAKVILPPEEVKLLEKEGIHDATRDTVLEDVAPDDYYRACFQSKDYTINQWSRYFDIVDYVEQGASNYHDIVVMRKQTEA